jgi:hypothetical protein
MSNSKDDENEIICKINSEKIINPIFGDRLKFELPNGFFETEGIRLNEETYKIPKGLPVDISSGFTLPNSASPDMTIKVKEFDPDPPDYPGHSIFNFYGPVNFTGQSGIYSHSKDNSVKTSYSDIQSLFKDLNQCIGNKIPSKDQADLLNKSKEMEETANTNEFKFKYIEFVNLAAAHMSIISPFIPALTVLMA